MRPAAQALQGRFEGSMAACILFSIFLFEGPKKEQEDFWPGSRRNPLKRLDPAKEIQGDQSLFL
jgi:hypothetical protein